VAGSEESGCPGELPPGRTVDVSICGLFRSLVKASVRMSFELKIILIIGGWDEIERGSLQFYFVWFKEIKY